VTFRTQASFWDDLPDYRPIKIPAFKLTQGFRTHRNLYLT